MPKFVPLMSVSGEVLLCAATDDDLIADALSTAGKVLRASLILFWIKYVTQFFITLCSRALGRVRLWGS